MEHRTRSTPVWPILLVLALLFAMSITAPRHWEKFAQRTPLEKPVRLLARSTFTSGAASQVAAMVKHGDRGREAPLGQTAETQPRITGNYEVAGKPTAAYAQPNLTAKAADVPQLAAATVPGIPRLSARPNLPTLPAPQTVEPPLTKPVEEQPARSLSQPEPRPQIETRPQVESPTAAAPIAAPLPAYRPSPSGFKLHAGHMQPPVETSPTVPTPIVTTPVVQTPSSYVKSAVPTPAPQIAPQVASIPKLPSVVSVPPSATPAVPQLTPSIPTPVPSAGPALVARRDDHKSLNDPIKSLPTPQQIAAPAPSKTPVTSQAPPSWWPRPDDLYARLETLAKHEETRTWATRTRQLLDNLQHTPEIGAAPTSVIFKQLRTALVETRLLEEQKLDPQIALEIRLTRHALQRRLDVWESLAGLAEPKSESAVAKRNAEDLAVCLGALDRQTSEAGETGRQWHDYLMLDRLAATAGAEVDPSESRKLAQTVLERLRRASEGSSQNAFLHEGAFADLGARLQVLAEEDVDAQTLLRSIEQFETGQLPADAHALAEQCRRLDFSAEHEKRQLAVWLTSHYRNANVRITLSADLLNRMLPDPLRRKAPVNDTVLGMPTQGWSTTRTGVAVSFLPSTDRLAMRMQAEGVVHAQTQTFSGPVRLFNHSDSTFTAYKDFSLTSRGVEVAPAVAQTLSRSRLQNIRTDFDHMPILGGIVESIALDKAAESRYAAQREASAKVSRRVEAGLDQELNKHLSGANTKLQELVVEPLGKIGLGTEVIELQSNEARAIMRLRIAGEDQLASHTPRPRAYSDNVASVQIHQSAVNNVLERIGFAGRNFTAAELYRFAVDELYLPDTIEPSQIPDDIEITFAAEDPLTIRCESGHIELRLAIAELKRAGKSWRDFVVRTEFKPTTTEAGTCFVREGTIHLSGPRLSTTSQIALRTVFAKVFPDDTLVPLWPKKLHDDPRFADLDVQQVDIRDGWLGMAVGPRRVPTTTVMGLRPPRR